jgi:hypothetical protein
MSGNMKLNGLVKGGDLTSTTSKAVYPPGAIYTDELTGANWQYVYVSSVISSYFQVGIQSAVDGTTFTVVKKPVTSSTVGCGVTQQYFSAGTYGFIKKTGVAKAYVTSSVAAGATLMAHASTAGLFAAKTSTIANGVAQTLETGLGAGTTTTVYLMYPC